MDRDAMQRAFDDVFDQALIFHGFTDYMRDYEVITYSTASPSTGIAPAFDRYLFQYCVQAKVSSSVSPATADLWSREVGIRFHEAVIEGNGHHIELVFSDLAVTPLEPGYSPFIVTTD